MRLIRRRKQSSEKMADISLTRLMDPALTLLIIFMVATPMLHNSIRITLPQGSAQEARNTKQELVVEINKEGQFFLNGTRMSSKDIIAQLTKTVGQRKEQVVFIKGDKDSHYGPVMEFVDQVKMVS